jgi:hypothetical protein
MVVQFVFMGSWIVAQMSHPEVAARAGALWLTAAVSFVPMSLVLCGLIWLMRIRSAPKRLARRNALTLDD